MDKHNTPKRKFFDVPVLSYVGSKWKAADWIIRQIPPHESYIEPFAGSASIFLRKHLSQLEVLNDIDNRLMNFFTVLRDQPDELIRVIQLTPYSRKEFEQALAQPMVEGNPIESARRFYVALWHSFGSTLMYNSGWRHQTRVNGTNHVQSWRRMDGLWAAADRLQDAQLESLPASECIRHYDHPKALFYVDPPYVISSRNGSHKRYDHEMTNDDHIELAATLKAVEGMVILSGYDCPLYRDLYSDWTRIEKSVTTNGNGRAVESLWLSPSVVDAQLPLFRLIGG